jgi:hypothetical protein
MKENAKFISVNGRRIKLESITSYKRLLNFCDDEGNKADVIQIWLYNKESILLIFYNSKNADLVLKRFDSFFKPITFFENEELNITGHEGPIESKMNREINS